MNDIGVIIALGVLCFDCTVIDQCITLKLTEMRLFSN